VKTFRAAVVEDCELLAEGEDFELECRPAPERCSQGMKQRNDDRAHVRHATTNSGKTSMISRRIEFIARTGDNSCRKAISKQSRATTLN